MPRRTIALAAVELLAERRHATSEELAIPIAEAGLTRATSPTRAVTTALSEDGRFHRLDDGRWVVPAQLLAGVVLTHRATRDELANDALAIDPDLAPLMSVGVAWMQSPDGTPLRPAWDDEARSLTGIDSEVALQGPPGWLAGSGHETALLHVRLEGSRLSAEPGPEPPAVARMIGRRVIEAIRRAIDEVPGDGAIFGFPRSVSTSQVILGLLADQPELLREPMPPLASLLEGSGLEWHRSWIGHAGTDWELLDDFFDMDDFFETDDSFDPEADWDEPKDDDWLPDDDLADLDLDDEEAMTRYVAERFGLSDEAVTGLRVVLGAYEISRRGRVLEDEHFATLGEVVSDPGIALVLASYAGHEPGLEPFVVDIEQRSGEPSAAGARYVLAACAEGRDDLHAAEGWLRAAVAADPAFEPAAIELARFELDRGRFRESVRLLREAGVPADDPARAWLEGIISSGSHKVGRNDPCPCGSGRKYKVCHLGREDDVAGVDPAALLMHKIWRWLDRPAGRRQASDLLQELEPWADMTDEEDDEFSAIESEFIDDVLLFDRGQLARFLDLHRDIVPSHELELGRTWTDTRRSVYEVRTVRPGRVVVRDLIDERPDIEVIDRALSRQVDRLDLLCLRLVPSETAGFTPMAAMLIPRTRREHVIDLVRSNDPLRLLRWLEDPAPMPRLANMEGEPLLLIEAVYRLADPVAAAEALSHALRPEGGGRFVDFVEHRGQDLIRGSVRIEGTQARLEANSRERADRLERTLLAAAPGSRLIRRTERSIEDALEDLGGDQPPAGSAGIDPDHPALRDAMEQFMRDHERRWVDESIPALDGMTPRQAIGDAAMRPRLEALLDDMEWQTRRASAGRSSNVGTMDAGRVRVLLGLAEPDQPVG